MSSATTNMARKKEDSEAPEPGRPRRGRPKGAGRITSRYAIAYTPEHRAWMLDFMETLGESEAADVWRDALRHYAISKGFRPPPKM